MKSMRTSSGVIVAAAFTAACLAGCDPGGVSFSLAGPPPGTYQSPGGIWIGTDAAGDSVAALANERGSFKLIGDGFNQGYGVFTVTQDDSIGGLFFVIPEHGSTLPDGTSDANCGLEGTVAERQSLTVTVDCTTATGLQNVTTLLLAYDPLYERDSSLTIIAGNFDDGAGNVMNIAADGTLFMQDAITNCVLNGQVIDDSSYNLYSIDFDISNCTGPDEVFNDSYFSGFATLDNTVVPEQLIFSAISNSSIEPRVSIVGVAERL